MLFGFFAFPLLCYVAFLCMQKVCKVKIVHRGSYCSGKPVPPWPPNKRTNQKTSLTSAEIIFVPISAISNQLLWGYFPTQTHSEYDPNQDKTRNQDNGAHVNTLTEIQRAGSWQGCHGNCTIKAQEDVLCMGQEERERSLWAAQVRFKSSTLTSISI